MAFIAEQFNEPNTDFNVAKGKDKLIENDFCVGQITMYAYCQKKI